MVVITPKYMVSGWDWQAGSLVKNWDFTEDIRDEATLFSEFNHRFYFEDHTLDTLAPNGEWQVYRCNSNHIFTERGLALVARPNTKALTSGAIESGMLRSKWIGRYGFYEASMKVPKARGGWSAFWLYPWPGDGDNLEIDIMEILHSTTDFTTHSFHFLHGPSSGTTIFHRLDVWEAYHPGFDFADDFHVFAIDWDSTGVRHYVDGILVKHTIYPWQMNDLSEGPMVTVLANLAVGGTWPGDPIEMDEFPAFLEIEYIRVWQR